MWCHCVYVTLLKNVTKVNNVTRFEIDTKFHMLGKLVMFEAWIVGKKDKHDIESLRKEILSKLDPDIVDAKKRIIPVMARLDSSLVEFLDALVKLKICSSRSDAVASIIKQAIIAQPEVFEQVRTQAEKLDGENR